MLPFRAEVAWQTSLFPLVLLGEFQSFLSLSPPPRCPFPPASCLSCPPWAPRPLTCPVVVAAAVLVRVLVQELVLGLE